MIIKRHNIDLIKLVLFILLDKKSVATIVIGYLDSQAKTGKWILKAINFILTVLEFC